MTDSGSDFRPAGQQITAQRAFGDISAYPGLDVKLVRDLALVDIERLKNGYERSTPQQCSDIVGAIAFLQGLVNEQDPNCISLICVKPKIKQAALDAGHTDGMVALHVLLEAPHFVIAKDKNKVDPKLHAAVEALESELILSKLLDLDSVRRSSAPFNEALRNYILDPSIGNQSKQALLAVAQDFLSWSAQQTSPIFYLEDIKGSHSKAYLLSVWCVENGLAKHDRAVLEVIIKLAATAAPEPQPPAALPPVSVPFEPLVLRNLCAATDRAFNTGSRFEKALVDYIEKLKGERGEQWQAEIRTLNDVMMLIAAQGIADVSAITPQQLTTLRDAALPALGGAPVDRANRLSTLCSFLTFLHEQRRGKGGQRLLPVNPAQGFRIRANDSARRRRKPGRDPA